MLTKKCLAKLLLIAVVTSTALSADKPADANAGHKTQGPSGTRHASCLLKISSDPAILPLSFETIDYLLHSSGISGAARETLGLPAEEAIGLFRIEQLGASFAEPADSRQIPSTPAARLSTRRPISTMRTDGQAVYTYSSMEAVEVSVEPTTPGEPKQELKAIGDSPGVPRTSATPRSPAQPQPAEPGTAQRPPRVYYYELDDRTRAGSGSQPHTLGPGYAAPQGLPLEQVLLLHLVVDLPDDANPVAVEFMRELVRNLQDALRGFYEVCIDRFDRQLRIAEEEIERTQSELRKLQDELRNTRNSVVLEDRIGTLREKLETTKMNLASNQAMATAITEQIEKARIDLDHQLQTDSVTKELELLHKLTEQQIAEMKKMSDAGRVSQAEIQQLEEKLARARIDLAKRREELSKAGGGSLIESLNRQLADLAIQDTRTRKLMENYQQQIDEANEDLAKAADFETLSLKVGIAKQGLQETLIWRDRLSRQIRMLQEPAASVLGAR
jgi:hypothetical protein